MLINEDNVSISKLRSLIGKHGVAEFAGNTSRCTVESITLDENGIKLVLRDEYNKRVKRHPSKFTPNED